MQNAKFKMQKESFTRRRLATAMIDPQLIRVNPR
jgi:hypothetical protein